MHSFHGTTTGIIHIPKGGIPLKGDGCAAGYAGF